MIKLGVLQVTLNAERIVGAFKRDLASVNGGIIQVGTILFSQGVTDRGEHDLTRFEITEETETEVVNVPKPTQAATTERLRSHWSVERRQSGGLRYQQRQQRQQRQHRPASARRELRLSVRSFDNSRTAFTTVGFWVLVIWVLQFRCRRATPLRSLLEAPTGVAGTTKGSPNYEVAAWIGTGHGQLVEPPRVNVGGPLRKSPEEKGSRRAKNGIKIRKRFCGKWLR
jgi:hypothetical protein